MDLNLKEAQLYRLLGSIFGKENIICRMSVASINNELLQTLDDKSLINWAKNNRFLFAITNNDGDPKMIVEIASDMKKIVDLAELEYRKNIMPFLKLNSIHYVEISDPEMEMLLSNNGMDLVTLLQSKLNLLKDQDII